MGEPIKKDPYSTEVIKQYKEQDRHGSTYTAQRLPVGQRRDFQPRIKRTPGGQPR